MNLNVLSPTQFRSNQLFKFFSLTSIILLMVTAAGSSLPLNRTTISQASNTRQVQIKRNNDHPIAIKQVRNAQSEHFLHDAEIEIQNISNRPVYYVNLYIRFPDIQVMPKVYYAFSLAYGDPRLENVNEPARPDDQPIPPGGTVTLTVPSNIWKAFEWYQDQKQLSPAASNRVQIEVQEVSFGDGTKYEWDRPHPRTQSSENKTVSKPKGNVAIKGLVDSPFDSLKVSLTPSAASYLAAIKRALGLGCILSQPVILPDAVCRQWRPSRSLFLFARIASQQVW